MQKSIDDYRNIIKILKLQLLKIRQENGSLSHSLGIASESETSSFSPKINHYKQSNQPFAKNILSFLNVAHRCEIIGVTPEMLFRIADKKRDKQVGVNSFGEILRRLKLRMSPEDINQFASLVQKDGQIEYESYLQALSAFGVNAEKYPFKGGRTYVQLCLIKFGQEAKDVKDADALYAKMNRNQDKPYLSFQNFANYVKGKMNLQEFQLIAVFVGLDVKSQCQIQKEVFRREVGKVYGLLQRGVNFEEEISKLSIDSRVDSKVRPEKSRMKNDYADQTPGASKMKGSTDAGRQKQAKSKDDDFGMDQETGVEAAVKKKPKKPLPAPEPSGKQIKLSPGNSKKLIDELKREDVRISDFLMKILSRQQKDKMVRSFTVHDFYEAVRSVSTGKFPKKKVMALFKILDTEANGTIDTAELIKLWIRAKETTDSDEVLYRMLYRHLREIQYNDPIQRFQILGIKADSTMTREHFKKVFTDLQLQNDQIETIMVRHLGSKVVVSDFCQILKSQGKPASSKKFNKMEGGVYNQLKASVKKINQRRNRGKECRWRKLQRLETGQKSTADDYWQFIFTDQWACWQYCLDVAYKLDTFWKDPQFGPTKSDPNGIRSIIGNESEPPPALPDQSQIQWMNFQDLLARKKQKGKVVFLEDKLNANQVVQGNIGDCWYVSSLSIIANREEYIKGYPYERCKKDQASAIYGVNPYLFKFFTQFGMYIFKFYKKFQPVYVVVDDLFPVQTGVEELLFAKSPDPGMQWPAFLEKAYAKLHHAYSNMISGDIAQGLNDLTNSVPIKQSLQKEHVQENMKKIRRLNEEGELMGCSISAEKGAGVEQPVTLDDQRCGLFYGHAYSIIDFLDMDTRDKSHFDLMRVRNPWGHGEWLLDWSDTPIDNDPDYQKFKAYQKDIDSYYEKKKREAGKRGLSVPDTYSPNAKDGEFLMKFVDFNELYTNLFTGFTVDTFNSRYQGRSISQRWDDDMPSGICKMKGATEKDQINFVKNNSQYVLEVEQDQTDILMYVVQEDGRLYRGEKYPYKELCNPCLIMCFDLESNQKELDKFDDSKFTVRGFNFERRREVNFWHKFKKGKYAVIPCKMKNKIKETDFEFRIYTEVGKRVNVRRVRGGKGNHNDFKKLKELESEEVDGKLYGEFLGLLEKHIPKSQGK